MARRRGTTYEHGAPEICNRTETAFPTPTPCADGPFGRRGADRHCSELCPPPIAAVSVRSNHARSTGSDSFVWWTVCRRSRAPGGCCAGAERDERFRRRGAARGQASQDERRKTKE